MPGDRASGIVWGFMQAHKQMDEFMKEGFSASRTLSHILNIHLRDHAITTVRFDELKKLVLAVKGTADSAKKIADKALSRN